jgi:hypothetical protein
MTRIRARTGRAGEANGMDGHSLCEVALHG